MKNKRKPDIRFPGFSGDWEQCNLGNISTKIGSGKTPKGGNQNYKSEGIPLLRSQNIFNNKVNLNDVAYITPEIDEDMANSRVQKGDVLLNITGASIGRSAVYKLNHKANVNQHVSIIRPSSEVNPYFIQLNIASEKGQKQIELNQAGGGREGLNFQQIAKMAFYFPNLVEQGKIGDFFVQLDNIISLHQQELTTLKQTKQGFLQKMFPKEGEFVPEIRFPGFTGDWKQCKLGDNVEFYSGLTYSPDNIMENGTLVLRSSNVKNGEIVDADNVYVDPKAVNSQNVEIGDVIVVVRNGSRNLIGKHASIKKKMENTVIGAFMTGIRSKIPSFTNALLDSNQFAIEISKNLGATINQITTGEFKKMKFSFPSNDEQEKIGTFFKQLDDTIALHQRELDALKETKKAFLQKMFV